MDPTECLRQILEKAAEIQRLEDLGPETKDVKVLQENVGKICDLGMEIAELVQALNMWIVSGGFLPDQWRPCTECGPEHGTREGRCIRHGKLVLSTRPRGIPS